MLYVGILSGLGIMIPTLMFRFSIRYIDRKIFKILLRGDWVIGMAINGGSIGVLLAGISKMFAVWNNKIK